MTCFATLYTNYRTMRKNYETALCGDRSVLVPYRPEHVERYHEWMKSPFLLEMTGSEPLSFEEEVKMQLSWRDDDDKCTFIILNREACESSIVAKEGYVETSDCARPLEDIRFITNTLDAMIGDVNLFISDEEDGENEDEAIDDSSAPRQKQAELDLMVAVESARGQGIGKEAACLMMLYGAQVLGIRKFTVKIKEENEASRHLFEKVRFSDLVDAFSL